MKTINLISNLRLIFYNKIVLILLFNSNFLKGQSSDIDILRDRVYHNILVLTLSKKLEVRAENFRSEWIADPSYIKVIVNLPKRGYSGKYVVIR